MSMNDDNPKEITLTASHVFAARGRNRRFTIALFECPNGEKMFLVKMRRLIGDWKRRQIQVQDVRFGVQTFALMKRVLQMIFDDSEIMGLLYDEMKVASSHEEQYTVKTNIQSINNQTK